MDKLRETANPHASASENERFALFERSLEREGFSDSTRACYASDWWTVSEHVHESTGRRFRIDRFAPEDFVLLRAELAARGAAPSTLNRRLAFLRRYTSFLAKGETSLRNVADGFSAVPFQTVDRSPRKTLTHAQEQRLRAAADALGVQASALVALLLGTGLRGAEAAELRQDDILGPRSAPTGVRVRGPRAKTILLVARARSKMLELLRDQGSGPGEPLFRDEEGNPLGETGVAAVVERAARDAGVEATPRTLRHTFGVRYLSEHRDDLDGLAQALGQTSLAAARAYRSEAEAATPVARRLAWDEIEETVPRQGVRRRALAASRFDATRELVAPGTELAARTSAEERMTFVLSGRVSFRVGRESVEATAGDFMHTPERALYGYRVEGDRPALLLHVVSPSRREGNERG